MTATPCDVVVLGGGVIGLTAAIALLDEGRAVTVLERGQTGHGSSHGNCGTITPSHAGPLAAPGMVTTALRWLFMPDAPLRIKPRLDPALMRWLLDFASRCNAQDYQRALLAKSPLLERSRDLLAQLISREGMASEFDSIGTMVVCRNAKSFEELREHNRELAEVGIPVETLDAEQTLQREPALKQGVAGSSFFPGDAQLRPDRHLAELARIVRTKGGTIIENATVQSFVSARGRIERIDYANEEATDTHQIAPREVVFALGAWTPALAKNLGLRLPIQPGKGYSITYSRPTIAPRIPVTLRERSVCVTAWESGFRIGSTMEFAGYDSSLNPRRLDALRRAAREYLVEPAGPEQIEEWFGWRPMTSDDLPIIGRAPGIDNLIVATGHGMLGMTMSAGTAEVVADLAMRRAPTLDVTAFDPARFAR
ncbi:MAG: FAD-dependent oxidoreductase [Dokdonella sp.]